MSEWKRVVHSAECDEDGTCPVCGDVDFGDCDCPGPTQHETHDYRLDAQGVMWARRREDSEA
jgi:hypothetical protein